MVKFNPLYLLKEAGEVGATKYDQVELITGERRALSAEEKANYRSLPKDNRVFTVDNLTSPRVKVQDP